MAKTLLDLLNVKKRRKIGIVACSRLEYRRKYYQQILKDDPCYRQKNIEKSEEFRKKSEYNKLYAQLPENCYTRYRYDAKRREIIFDLTYEQFIEFFQKPCFYCNSESDSTGLDRIDNNIGYIYENIVPCCYECNFMKRTLSIDHFFDQIKKIYNIHFGTL